MLVSLESLLTGENAAYIDGLYQIWLADPKSVSADWAQLFAEQEIPQGSTARPTFASPSIFSPGGSAPSTGAADPEAAALQAKVPNSP